MKSIKALLAIVLACVLALGLFACAAEEEKEQAQKTPLAVAQSDPLVYYNTLVGLLQGAESFVMELGYSMDNIETGNGTLKEAKDLIKGYIIDYIKDSVTYNKKPKDDERPMASAAEGCPALFNALLPGDLLETLAFNELIEGKVAANLKKLEEDIGKGLVESLRDEKGISLKDGNGKPVAAARASDAQKRVHAMAQLNEVLIPGGMLAPLKVNEVLELRVAEKLRQLEIDIENGLVSRLTDADGKTLKGADGKTVLAKDATDEQKRIHVLGQLSENAVTEASGLFRIDGKLSPAAAEKLFTPADKADILAQLAKAEAYLLVEDYTLEPTEFTLYAQVNKFLADADTAQQIGNPAQAEDRLKELTLELKANLTATARGTGAFEDAGEFLITLTLKKTVSYKDIMWEIPEEE